VKISRLLLCMLTLSFLVSCSSMGGRWAIRSTESMWRENPMNKIVLVGTSKVIDVNAEPLKIPLDPDTSASYIELISKSIQEALVEKGYTVTATLSGFTGNWRYPLADQYWSVDMYRRNGGLVTSERLVSETLRPTGQDELQYLSDKSTDKAIRNTTTTLALEFDDGISDFLPVSGKNNKHKGITCGLTRQAYALQYNPDMDKIDAVARYYKADTVCLVNARYSRHSEALIAKETEHSVAKGVIAAVAVIALAANGQMVGLGAPGRRIPRNKLLLHLQCSNPGAADVSWQSRVLLGVEDSQKLADDVKLFLKLFPGLGQPLDGDCHKKSQRGLYNCPGPRAMNARN